MTRVNVFFARFLLLAMLLVSSVAGAKTSGEAASDGLEDHIKDRLFSVLGRGGGIGGVLDNVAITPIIEYFTTAPDPSGLTDPQADAFFLYFISGIMKCGFPEYALTVDVGRIVIGGTAVAFTEFWDAVYRGGRQIAAERFVFGGNMPVDQFLGNIDRLLRDQSFFNDYLPRRSPRITPENIGQTVTSEAALRQLWFKDYAGYLRSGVFSLPSLRADADKALDTGWPTLLKYWQASRAADLVLRLNADFRQTLRSMPPQAEMQKITALAALKCTATHSQPIWNEAEKRALCGCEQNYKWNQGGTRCILEPAAQVAALSCPSNAEGFWNSLAEQAQCRCNGGYRWNVAQTACLPDPAELVAATRCQPNAQAYWNEELGKVRCRCAEGHVWNEARTACVSEAQAKLAALNCPKYYANSQPTWNEEQERGECVCKQGYRWNEKRDACMVDPKAQVALMNCKGAYPNAETYWDPTQQVARCRCVNGFRWNSKQQACLADVRDSTMDALLGEVEGNQHQADAVNRGEKMMAAEQQEKAGYTDNGPSLNEQPAGPSVLSMLTNAMQTYQNIRTQSSGPGNTSSAPVSVGTGIKPVPVPVPPPGTAHTSAAQSNSDHFNITGSALPTSHELYRKHLDCRYIRAFVLSNMVADVRPGEIDQTVAALRAKGHAAVEAHYFDGAQAQARVDQARQTEDAGRDACWKAQQREKLEPR